MNRRRDDADVQECACWALEQHANHNHVSAATALSVETLISAGAAASILAAMDLHPADPKVQHNAVHALCAFVSATSTTATSAAATEFMKGGAPTRILAAMERYSSDLAVQDVCCFAVAGLIDNESARTVAFGEAARTEAFGIASAPLILDAMFQHIDNRHLCEAVFRALRQLTYFRRDIAEGS
jgi:hypothetical protein